MKGAGPSGRVRSAVESLRLGHCLEGGHLKYMIEYSVRFAGLSHDENSANQEALLIRAFGKWQPEDGLTPCLRVAREQ